MSVCVYLSVCVYGSICVCVLPAPGGALLFVGEAGQVLGDGGSALGPVVVQHAVLGAVFCRRKEQLTSTHPIMIKHRQTFLQVPQSFLTNQLHPDGGGSDLQAGAHERSPVGQLGGDRCFSRALVGDVVKEQQRLAGVAETDDRKRTSAAGSADMMLTHTEGHLTWTGSPTSARLCGEETDVT